MKRKIAALAIIAGVCGMFIYTPAYACTKYGTGYKNYGDDYYSAYNYYGHYAGCNYYNYYEDNSDCIDYGHYAGNSYYNDNNDDTFYDYYSENSYYNDYSDDMDYGYYSGDSYYNDYSDDMDYGHYSGNSYYNDYSDNMDYGHYAGNSYYNDYSDDMDYGHYAGNSYYDDYNDYSDYTDYNTGYYSYINVDIDAQTIRMVYNGEEVVSGPIVSGMLGVSDTPRGIYSIQGMHEDLFINDNAYVDYWMPFFGSYGIHDADRWRSEYGQEDYIYNGSHGCVNIPGDVAEEIYNLSYIGMPVIIQ